MKVFWILCVVLLSGCASFKNSDEPNSILLDQSEYQNKPSVYIDLSYSMNGSVISESEFLSEVKNNLTESLDRSGVFSEYTFVSSESNNMDYRLELKIINSGDVAAATMAGFLTGYSLFLIPTFATDNFDVEALLYDKRGQKLDSTVNEDSFKTWLGIWFLPVMGSNHPKDVVQDVVKNLVIKSLNDMIRRGQLKYSQVYGKAPLA